MAEVNETTTTDTGGAPSSQPADTATGVPTSSSPQGRPRQEDVSDDSFVVSSGSLATFEPPSNGDITPKQQQQPQDKRQPSQEAKPAPKPGSESRPTRAERRSIPAREAKLTSKLGDLTRQIREAEQRIAALTSSTPKSETKTESKPDASGEDDFPKAPLYRDYDTDPEYDAAVAKHEADVRAWAAKQRKGIIDEATGAVEKRLTDAERMVEQRKRAEAFQTSLHETRERIGAEKWDAAADALGDIESPWYDPESHGDDTTPFLTAIVRHRGMNASDAGEIMYFLGEDPDRAQRLAELMPTVEIYEALVEDPNTPIIPLLAHFATDQGRNEFDELVRMPPRRAVKALGALASRLTAADRGPASSARPVTKAMPPAKPPVGQPSARSRSADDSKTVTFKGWMEDEDRKELHDRARRLGVSIPD